jgi:MFS family permease
MAWVGSLINAGALFGALIGGLLMDKFGRKTVLIFLSVPYVLGWLLLILAVDPSKQSLSTKAL